MDHFTPDVRLGLMTSEVDILENQLILITPLHRSGGYWSYTLKDPDISPLVPV